MCNILTTHEQETIFDFRVFVYCIDESLGISDAFSLDTAWFNHCTACIMDMSNGDPLAGSQNYALVYLDLRQNMCHDPSSLYPSSTRRPAS